MMLDKVLFLSALKENDLTIADLTKRLGMSRGYFNSISNGLIPSEGLRQRIAKALLLKTNALWVEVYR